MLRMTLSNCLKTVVAFANSVRIDYPPILFVDVTDDGEPESAIADLDRLPRRLKKNQIKRIHLDVVSHVRLTAISAPQFAWDQ
jgi:hypothetical protein